VEKLFAEWAFGESLWYHIRFWGPSIFQVAKKCCDLNFTDLLELLVAGLSGVERQVGEVEAAVVLVAAAGVDALLALGAEAGLTKTTFCRHTSSILRFRRQGLLDGTYIFIPKPPMLVIFLKALE
jgi:hypothetical protein